MLNTGYLINNISTKNITNANGSPPINTSLRLILSSSKLDLITKQLMPKGGVSKPISAPTTVTIPNQTKLN